ncbi:RING finger domain (Znf1) protein [Rutstroemia sp. NJR-2017a WRK4]|nr:RING finger domain (Znf1) protein [Rutstroemia sp. NJR-2017a WRK4]
MPPKRNIQETETEEPFDWNMSTVPQLKAELGFRQLPKTGRKADLVARLQAHDAGTLVTEPAAPDVADAPADSEPSSSAPAPKKKRAKKEKSPDVEIEGELAKDVVTYQNFNPETGEQRLRPFVGVPDDKFKDKVKKIRKEHRQRTQDREGYPSQRFDIAGSTGNIYQAEIGRNPKCTCMDALAFMSDEIASIFANAPVTQAPSAEHSHEMRVEDESLYNGKRKPIEGDCPICVFEMEAGEEIVWCKAACGQNFHKECFDQWRLSKRGGTVTCVYCRTPWQEDAIFTIAALKNSAPKIGSYQNIAHMPMYSQAGVGQ